MGIYWRKISLYKILFTTVVTAPQNLLFQDRDGFTQEESFSLNLYDDSTNQTVFQSLVPTMQSTAPLKSGWYSSGFDQQARAQDLHSQNATNAYQSIGNSGGPIIQQERSDVRDLQKQVLAAVLKAQLGQEKFQELVAALHLKKYGVSHDFLWGKIKIIDNKELTIVIKNHPKDINIVTLLPYIEKI